MSEWKPQRPDYVRDADKDSAGHVIRLGAQGIDIYRWDAAGGIFVDLSGQWIAPSDIDPKDGDEYLGQLRADT